MMLIGIKMKIFKHGGYNILLWIILHHQEPKYLILFQIYSVLLLITKYSSIKMTTCLLKWSVRYKNTYTYMYVYIHIYYEDAFCP